jgi:hypothetical protein
MTTPPDDTSGANANDLRCIIPFFPTAGGTHGRKTNEIFLFLTHARFEASYYWKE